MDAELEPHRHLDVALVRHLQHLPHQVLSPTVTVFFVPRQHGTPRAEGPSTFRTRIQLGGAEGEVLHGQRPIAPAGGQRRVEARLGHDVAIFNADHRLDVGDVPLGTAGVAVERDEVDPQFHEPVEVNPIVLLVPGGGSGKEVVPRQSAANGKPRGGFWGG
jgi:hypothetical protein